MLAFVPKDKREGKHHGDKAQEAVFCGFEEDYIHGFRLYKPDTNECLVTNKIQAVQLGTHYNLDDSIRPNIDLNDKNVSSEMEIEETPVGHLSDYQWLLNKRHTDEKDGLLYEVTRLGIYKRTWICAWRKRGFKDGRL